MLKEIFKSTAALTFIVLTSLPASAQPDVRVEMQLPGLEVRIGHRAPPPLQREVRPNRPSRNHTWVPGSWDWQRNDWAWISGRWDRPQHGRASWVKARYVREGRAWRYEPGHWSNQRVVRGEDYRRWREDYRRDRNSDPSQGRGNDHNQRNH